MFPIWEQSFDKSSYLFVRIISTKPLRDFYVRHNNAEGPIRAWVSVVKKAKWKSLNELKKQFGNASIVENDRVVFNFKGNDYRLVIRIDFTCQLIFIRFIGTHKEYDSH